MWTPPTSNGHYPTVLDGLVAFGAGQITIADFRTDPPWMHDLGPGYDVVWKRPFVAVFFRNIDDLHQQAIEATFGPPGAPPAVQVLPVDSTLAAGNAHSGGNNTFASWLAFNNRIYLDGVGILTQGRPCVGVALGGRYVATNMEGPGGDMDRRLVVWRDGIRFGETSPRVNPVEFKVTPEGILTYGYNSSVWGFDIERGEPSHTELTVTPWGRESCPVIVQGPDTLRWVWTGTFHPTRGPVVLGRQYGSLSTGVAVVIDGLDAGHGLSVGTLGNEWIIAAASATGQLRVVRTATLTFETLRPAIEPFPRPIVFAPYFQFSDRPGYGDLRDYPAKNATIIVEPSVLARAQDIPTTLGLMIGADTRDGVDTTMLDAGILVKERVVALVLGSEWNSTQVEPVARAVKDAWQARRGPRVPVYWYITTPEQVTSIPPSVDWFGPQYYFPAGTPFEGMQASLWRMTARWLEVLGRSKPWLPVIQAFNRANPANTPAIMEDLARFQPEFLRMLKDPDPRYGDPPPSLGVTVFAVTRPGGARDYPSIQAWHRAIVEAIPDGPIQTPGTGGGDPGAPTVDKPKITITSPTFPVTVSVGQGVRCTWTKEEGSGPIETVEWLVAPLAEPVTFTVAARNPADDPDHTYRFDSSGGKLIALRATGPGGAAQTATLRVVNVTAKPVEPPPPPPPPPPPTGDTVVITSVATGKILCVDRDAPGPPPRGGCQVLANRTEAGGWETQEFVWQGKQVAFRNYITDEIKAFLCADYEVAPEGPFLANRPDGTPGDLELFTPEIDPEGVTYFKNAQSGKYLSVDPQGRVFANGAGQGPSEQFRTSTLLVPSGGGGGQIPFEPGQIAGRIRIVDGRCQNDAGWWLWQSMSAFSLVHRLRIGDESWVVSQLQRAVNGGRTMVRVLGMADNLFKLRPDMPGYVEAVQRLFALAAKFGLYVEFVIYADASRVMPERSARHGWTGFLVSTFKDVPNVVWQIVNEPGANDGLNGWTKADDPDLLQHADEMAAILGHRDFSIGDVPDAGAESGASVQEMLGQMERHAQHCNLLMLHGDRSEDNPQVRCRWVEHLKGLTDNVYEVGKRVGRKLFAVQDEPMGAAGVYQRGKRDDRAAAHVAAACQCAVMGLGFTYHFISEQDDTAPGLAECAVTRQLQACAAPNFVYENANIGNAPIGTFEGYDKIRPGQNGAVAYAAGLGDARGRVGWRNGYEKNPQVLLDLENGGNGQRGPLVVTVWESVR